MSKVVGYERIKRARSAREDSSIYIYIYTRKLNFLRCLFGMVFGEVLERFLERFWKGFWRGFGEFF